jgi:hypothetical protein
MTQSETELVDMQACMRLNAKLQRIVDELCETLKALAEADEGGEASPGYYDAKDAARTALAKARGEQTA